MRFVMLAAAGILALVSSGCTSLSLSQNRRVGVVALIPDKVQTKYVGLWAFSNRGEDAPVPGARLSESVTASTIDALRANGFDAQPLAADPSVAWEKYDRQRGSFGNLFTNVTLGDTERRSLGADLKAAMAAQHLDAVVIVEPGKPAGGGEATVGVGDFGFGTSSVHQDRVGVYAMTNVLVLGGPNLSTRAFRPVSGSQDVEGLPFEAEFRRYSPQQQRMIIDAMKEVFRNNVRDAVGRMTRP